MNIENRPVIMRNPNNTFSLLLPNGRIRFFASKVSSPDFDAAMARMNPARKSIMIGSANEAIISSESNSSPMSSPLKSLNEFWETVVHMIVMMESDVAHAGIHSVNQDNVANTKVAMMRC